MVRFLTVPPRRRHRTCIAPFLRLTSSRDLLLVLTPVLSLLLFLLLFLLFVLLLLLLLLRLFLLLS